MKCGNPNCKSNLFSQEEQYFICPHCGNVIENNICNNLYYDDVYEISSYYFQRKNLIRIIKIILGLSPFIFHFVMKDIFLREYKSIFIFTQRSEYTVNRFLLPALIPIFIYIALNRENKVSIRLFEDKVFYVNSRIATMIKAVIYILLMLFMLNIEVPIFKQFLIESDKQLLSYTANQINQGVDKLVGEHIFLIVYSFIVFYVMELLDMYQHNLIKNINEQ